MPKRKDIKSILVLGAGPIVIGQACEFDYSGSQACKVLKQEGYRVILINSNPATIMTDPEFADATYIEPLTTDTVEKIIKEIDGSIIQDVITFDVYEGDNIPKGKKSVAINVTLQSTIKSLSEKDLDQISNKIVDVVKEKPGATIRS